MSYFKNKVKTGHLSFTEGGLKNFICSTSGATAEAKKMLLVGTNDHTAALVKTHEKEFKRKPIDYYELPYNDFLKY